jgi:Na+/melibiose symporter-like transporter
METPVTPLPTWAVMAVVVALVGAIGILWKYLQQRERKHDAREERHSLQIDKFIQVATEFRSLATDLKQHLNGGVAERISPKRK